MLTPLQSRASGQAPIRRRASRGECGRRSRGSDGVKAEILVGSELALGLFLVDWRLVHS
jgi:hypothetical protein